MVDGWWWSDGFADLRTVFLAPQKGVAPRWPLGMLELGRLVSHRSSAGQRLFRMTSKDSMGWRGGDSDRLGFIRGEFPAGIICCQKMWVKRGLFFTKILNFDQFSSQRFLGFSPDQ